MVTTDLDNDECYILFDRHGVQDMFHPREEVQYTSSL